MKPRNIVWFYGLLVVINTGCRVEPLPQDKYYVIRQEVEFSNSISLKVGKDCEAYLAEVGYAFNWLGSEARFRIRLLESARKVCARHGIPFVRFNKAHQELSRLGLTYWDEIAIFAGIYKRYRWDILSAERTITPIELTANKEAYGQLLNDLGFNCRRLEMDKNRRVRFDNKSMKSMEQLRREIASDRFESGIPEYIELIASPDIQTGEVFAFLGNLHDSYLVNVSGSFADCYYTYLSIETKERSKDTFHIDSSFFPFATVDLRPLKDEALVFIPVNRAFFEFIAERISYYFYSFFPYKSQEEKSEYVMIVEDETDDKPKPDSGIVSFYDLRYPKVAAFLKIDAKGCVFLNSEPIISEGELVSTIRILRSDKFSPYEVLIAASDSLAWGKVVELVELIGEGIRITPRLVPASDIESKEPHIQTRKIIEWIEEKKAKSK
ncbi:hypothetical protein JXM67_11925 [candidate division WOR-3 bacterium]|nr:hypothetical protein [candidate division WOR-3 bacterium]